MKTKFKIIILVFITLLFAKNLFGQSPITISTPKGHEFYAYEMDEIFDTTAKDEWSEYYAYFYPQAEEVFPRSTTSTYNCHSYAWNMSEGGPTCWIGVYSQNEEDIYWTDSDEGYSYVETTEPYASKISYYADDHSAIKTPQGDYISKWGNKVLMRHAAGYGPSSYQMSYRKYYKLNPKVTGTFSPLCSDQERTFYSDVSISGSTYSWVRDANRLNYVSGQGTTDYRVEAIPSGSAYVRMQITTPSGEIALTPYAYFWVGLPNLTSIESENGPYGWTDESYGFSIWPAYYQLTQADYSCWTSPYAYVWSLENCYAQIHFGDPDLYYIYASAENVCGTGNTIYTTFEILDFFSLSPNPASDMVTVTISKDQLDKSTNAIGFDQKFVVTIIDMYGKLLSQKQFSGDSFTIPVHDLQDGSYFVRISQGKKSTTKSLVVKH